MVDHLSLHSSSQKQRKMKNWMTLFAAIAVIGLVSCGETTAPSDATKSDADQAMEKTQPADAIDLMDGTYQIDPATSTVAWKGTKITGSTHEGNLSVYKGTINVLDKSVAGGFVAVDMKSMVCTDEGLDEEGKGNLIGHLMSDDFFGVERFPNARLELEGIKVKGEVAMGYGKIFIREIAQPINFPVAISQAEGNLIVDADVTFDRSKHDVKFRSGSFPDLFPDLGDKLINDEIELSVHIVGTM